MTREFKKGDRVLVRDGDLREWIPAVFKEIDSKYYFITTKDNGHIGVFYQCRHIDDFRTGDKVQVRNSMTEEWEDATYAVYIPRDSFEHWIFTEDMDDLLSYKLCRWHPSMPWAEEEQRPPLTLEQRVEALERKLNDQ